MLFLGISLLLLFFMQTISIKKYYEIYKKIELNKIVNKIKNDKEITKNLLDEISLKNDICLVAYDINKIEKVSAINNGRCIFNDKKKSLEYINLFISSKKDEETYILNNELNNKAIIKALKRNNNYIFVNASLHPLNSSIELIRSQYFLIIIILLIISVILAFVISKQLSRPIEEISESAKKLSSGDYDTKFKIKTNVKEINNLIKTLEKTRIELSKTEELRRDLMANVGHDLRTPLTMIKAYAEMSRDLDNQDDKKKKENLNIIIEETDRLNNLVNDILDLSKLQSKTYELKMEEFDLNEIIKAIIKRYYILIENEGYQFIYNNDEIILVYADKKRIEQVI